MRSTECRSTFSTSFGCRTDVIRRTNAVISLFGPPGSTDR